MRTLYIVCTLCVAVLALFFEENLLPVGFLDLTAEIRYVFDLLCVAMTLTGVFIALRLFKSKAIQEQLNSEDTGKAFEAYRKWNSLRISIIFFPIFWNLLIYYGVGFSQTAMFCLLITIIGALFCWAKSKP